MLEASAVTQQVKVLLLTPDGLSLARDPRDESREQTHKKAFLNFIYTHTHAHMHTHKHVRSKYM